MHDAMRHWQRPAGNGVVHAMEFAQPLLEVPWMDAVDAGGFEKPLPAVPFAAVAARGGDGEDEIADLA